MQDRLHAEKKRRAREAFDSNHFRAETIMRCILMMEKRPALLSALKELDSQKNARWPVRARTAGAVLGEPAQGRGRRDSRAKGDGCKVRIGAEYHAQVSEF
jgi:hypothetical protein